MNPSIPPSMTPTMGIAPSEVKVITEVGKYRSDLLGENIQCKDWSFIEVEDFIKNMDQDHDLYLPKGFIENIEKDPFQLYCDTDSDYLLIKTTFNKKEDIERTVAYCQKLTLRMNAAYMSALDLYFYKLANWHPDFNTMDFKSEVVAFKGFFAAKKFYALGIIWNEGKFLAKVKTKIIGGQLKKADVTKVTKEMLEDIYSLLTKDSDVKDEAKIYNKIFIEFKNRYLIKLKESINQLNFEYFTIPKKWSFGEKKNVPASITGAKLYNRIIKDTFSVGDSVLVLPIKFNLAMMTREFEKMSNPNENMLQNAELSSKIKDLSLPPLSKLTEADKDYIKQRFIELDIHLDYDKIIDFNIDMKLEPFKRLFSVETTRRATAIRG